MCTTLFPRLGCVLDPQCVYVLIKEINSTPSEHCLALTEPPLFVGINARRNHHNQEFDLCTEQTQQALSELKRRKFWVLSSFLPPTPRVGSHLSIGEKSDMKKAGRKVQEKRAAGLFPEELRRLMEGGCHPQLTSPQLWAPAPMPFTITVLLLLHLES